MGPNNLLFIIVTYFRYATDVKIRQNKESRLSVTEINPVSVCDNLRDMRVDVTGLTVANAWKLHLEPSRLLCEVK